MDAWENCSNPFWVFWICNEIKVDRKRIVLATCACARLALKFVKPNEERPRICIEVTERWTRGNATIEEVRKARDAASYTTAAAAYTSYAAAGAAGAAAYAAAYAADAAASYTAAAYATADAAGAAAGAAAYAAASYAAASYAAADDAAAAAKKQMQAHCCEAIRNVISFGEILEVAKKIKRS
jgi:hypothetical protein